jgi:hypothetical protein
MQLDPTPTAGRYRRFRDSGTATAVVGFEKPSTCHVEADPGESGREAGGPDPHRGGIGGVGFARAAGDLGHGEAAETPR